jgi:hypothetical protein
VPGSRPSDPRWRVALLTVALVAGLALVWRSVDGATPSSAQASPPHAASWAAPPAPPTSGLFAPLAPVLDVVVTTLTGRTPAVAATVARERCWDRQDTLGPRRDVRARTLALVLRRMDDVDRRARHASPPDALPRLRC